MERIVSAKRWMELAGGRGTFSSSRYGFTPRAETTVWPWRSLAEHILYFCAHGGFKVVFPERVVELSKGTFVWIMANVRNETRLIAPRKAFRTYFVRFSLTDEDGTPVRLASDCIYRPDAWNLLPHLRDLVEELQSPQEFHDERLHASLVMMSSSAIGAQMQRQRTVLTSQQRIRLQSYINAEVIRATPQSLADEVGLSLTYFRRIFQRSYGMPPKHWIVRQRIMLAALMMSETQLTAKEVAYRLGYCDRYLFSRQFKQVMGVPARLFRRGAGAEPQWDHITDRMDSSPLFRNASRDAEKLKKHRPRTT